MNDGPTSGILWLPNASYEAALSRFSPEELNRMDADDRLHFPPPNHKATLWKYLDTYKFEDLLNCGALYLRQVAKLVEDEPNEGRMNQIQEKALLEYLSNDQAQLKNFHAFHEHVRQNSWVTCFSRGEFDEAHMWEKFCKHTTNEGVAIRTNYKRLKPDIDRHSNARCAMVRYRESAYMPMKSDYLLFQKLLEFSDEQEVRVCVLNLEEANPKEYLPLPVNLTRLIQRIYVHPKASPDYLKKISDLAAKHLQKNSNLICWSRHRAT